MFTIRIGGIEVTCEGVADAAALIAALGERGAARLLPDAAAGRTADTGSGPPSPAAPEPFVARAGPPPRVPQRAPRPHTCTDAEIRDLHARFLKGARLDDLAAERERTGEWLRLHFKRLGLATRFARPNPVAAPSPPKVAAAPRHEKWTVAAGHECVYVDGVCLGCDQPKSSYRKAG